MSIGQRLREAREHKGYTQRELASRVGCTNGAIANYEAGTSHPKENILIKLLEVLGVDANYIYQDYQLPKADEIKLNDTEYRLIARYRVLDDSGKSFVETVVQREYQRVIASSRPHLTIAANPGTASQEELEAIAYDALEQARKLSD